MSSATCGELLVLARQLRIRLEEIGQLVRLNLDCGGPRRAEQHHEERPTKANALRITPAMTTIDWPMMYCGVPKKRAMRSAIRPNVSAPKALRCSCTATAPEA